MNDKFKEEYISFKKKVETMNNIINGNKSRITLSKESLLNTVLGNLPKSLI